jgi:hypothetical protein
MATFAQGSFIIPEGTTPDMLRAKRERLAALMPRYGQAKYVGEGLGQLFSGIAQGRQNRAMDAYEGDQRKAAADMFNSRGPLSVLGMQPPAGPNQDIADEALAAIGADGLPGSLVQSESGGNWGALNSEGYGGRGQFGTDRLADAARAGVIPAGMTGEAYSRAPKHVQLAVENWHKRDVLNNLGQYVGVDVDGPGPIPPLTEDSLLAVAHLGGQGGARRFIESGGQYNPADSNGTSLADYATRHASGQGGAASARGRTGGADVSYLMQLAANPWLTQEQRAVVTAELQQAQRQADPSYQMGLEMQRLQLDALRNPQAEFRDMTPEEVAARGLPPGAYQVARNGEIKPVTKGGVNVTNNIGGDDKFAEKFAELDAKSLATISESGTAAQRNLGRIDQLEKLLQTTPSGLAGAAKLRAGEWGINTEGLDDLQAAQALINSLVPEQRQPGSGPMSDADLELFKQSLPRIINQPGGNQLIIGTMRAIAQYDAEGAKIVQDLRANKIDRAQAFEMMLNRADPMAAFRSGLGAAPAPASGGGDNSNDPLGLRQ